MVDNKSKQSEKKEPIKADYKGATPRQVAKSVLTYRPKAV